MYAPGKILRSGGNDPAIASAATVDMNSPNAQWRQLSPMKHARRRHNLVILADGQVMAVGGTGRPMILAPPSWMVRSGILSANSGRSQPPWPRIDVPSCERSHLVTA